MPTHENTSTGAAGHSPASPGKDRHLYDLNLKGVQQRLVEAGLPRSDKSLRRYCQDGRLDCMKVDGATGPLYLVRSESVERLIGEFMQVQAIADVAGHSPAQSDSNSVLAQHLGSPFVADTAAQSPAEPEPADQEDPQIYSSPARDTAGHSPASSGSERRSSQGTSHSEPDEGSIFEHPYVLKLEARIDKLEERLEVQVRRTEEIQTNARQELIELQRASQVAQSKTLAEYLLRAKEFLLGSPDGVGDRGDYPQPQIPQV